MTEALGQLRHYPDPSYTALRRALADYHQVPPIGCCPATAPPNCSPGRPGNLAEAPVDRCHLLTPAFGDYGRALAAFGVPQVAWPLPLAGAAEGQAASLAELAPQATTQATGLLLNNPHNPTGRLFSAASLRPLVNRFATVIVDEAFMDFLPPTSSSR
jgi:histidinol-phosphate/aromatic aminotransferase/cobyric acid decarboxylase-like protein